MMLALPDVVDNLRLDFPDKGESELAMSAAILMVTNEWEEAGRLPADWLDMWPDVQLLLVQNGYKVE